MEGEGEVAVIAVPAGIPQVTFSKDQVELIKRTVARNTTDDELALFLYTAKRSGLDPLAKQIHCVKRSGKDGGSMSIQTAIDGYRLIADRTGKYAGNDDPIFDDEANPTRASVTVHKIVDGQRCAFTATARWSQYYPGDAQGFMWKKMPHLMLGKCAEALALRKAFPANLSGIYTDEEMHQADARAQEAQPVVSQPIRKVEQAPVEGQELLETIEAITVRPVQTKNGTKNVYAIKTVSGKKIETWDEESAKAAKSTIGTSGQVKMSITSDKWGMKLVSMEILPAEAES